MRMPERPPPIKELWEEIARAERFRAIMDGTVGPSINGKYLHWEKVKHHQPPADLSHREWWLGIKNYRRSLYKPVTLVNKVGKPFQYLLTDPIPERLHQIDLGAGGLIQMPDQITNPETKDQYYVSSLMEEAITSSQVEGAVTTRKVAKEMIRTGRPPRDDSERMILNNYRTMQELAKLKNEPLTKEVVFEIHRLITDQTLPDPSGAGRFRTADEQIVVGDIYGEVFHTPPLAEELGQRMVALCDFANGRTPERFIHPVIRSIILHFWIGYDHPFVEGNGRTARALFYWSMLRHGFWLFEFISISPIILKALSDYYRAYLYTETDDGDLTYFVLYHLEVIHKAIIGLHDYIKRKTQQLQALEARLRGVIIFNHRQRSFISHALRHPNQRYTIEAHKVSHNVVYQTARTDLLDLAEKKLFSAEKIGKTWYFTPVSNLEEKLARLS